MYYPLLLIKGTSYAESSETSALINFASSTHPANIQL